MMSTPEEPYADSNEYGESPLPEWWAKQQPEDSGNYAGNPEQRSVAKKLTPGDIIGRDGIHRSPSATRLEYDDVMGWLW